MADFPIKSLRVENWQDCKDVACYLGRGNSDLHQDSFYSKARFDYLESVWGSRTNYDKYDTYFIDSISVASRLCLDHCKNQPENKTSTGKVDIRKAYGQLALEMMEWLVFLQHIREKNIIYVCILDDKFDEYNKRKYKLQIEGSKVSDQLPGIVDQIITMTSVDGKAKFICTKINDFDFPSKDRSGKLNEEEEPDLAELIDHLNGKPRKTNKINKEI